MRERQSELDALHLQLIGVGTREVYQAKKLMDDGIGVELYLDPDNSLREALGVRQRFSTWRLLNPRGAVAYAKAIRRQAKHIDPVWSQATQRPGVVLFDSGGEVAWSHIGEAIGDYPTADTVLTEISAVLGPSTR